MYHDAVCHQAIQQGHVCTGLETQCITLCHRFLGDNQRVRKMFKLVYIKMYSSGYTYEGKSTNSYVTKVNLRRIKTPLLFGVTSMFKCKTGIQF